MFLPIWLVSSYSAGVLLKPSSRQSACKLSGMCFVGECWASVPGFNKSALPLFAPKPNPTCLPAAPRRPFFPCCCFASKTITWRTDFMFMWPYHGLNIRFAWVCFLSFPLSSISLLFYSNWILFCFAAPCRSIHFAEHTVAGNSNSSFNWLLHFLYVHYAFYFFWS